MVGTLKRAYSGGSLHHAYLLRTEGMSPELSSFFGEVSGDPQNVFQYTADQLTVDAARHIRSTVGQAHSGTRVVVIRSKSLTPQAQNALLKAIEEPIEGTHFFLLIPTGVMVLDTVRSRCIELLDNTHAKQEAAVLVSANYLSRKKIIAPVLASDDARTKAQELLRSELKSAHTSGQPSGILLELSRALELLGQPGTSPKLILEHLAAIL